MAWVFPRTGIGGAGQAGSGLGDLPGCDRHALHTRRAGDGGELVRVGVGGAVIQKDLALQYMDATSRTKQSTISLCVYLELKHQTR